MADRFRGSRVARRQTAWQQGPESVGAAITSTSAALWSATGASMASGREVTIVRTRGWMHAVMNISDTAQGGFRGACGIGIATIEAIAAGVAAVKHPLGDIEWDGWLWHSVFDVRTITSTIADGSNAAAVSQRVEIDSKAMRKISDEEVMFGVVEVVEVGISSMQLWANTRVLVKLA